MIFKVVIGKKGKCGVVCAGTTLAWTGNLVMEEQVMNKGSKKGKRGKRQT